MAMTALDLSPEGLKKYHPREAVRRRAAKFSAEISKRRARAFRRAQSGSSLENQVRRKGSDPVWVARAAWKFYLVLGY